MKGSYRILGPLTALTAFAFYLCQYSQTIWLFGELSTPLPLFGILIACYFQQSVSIEAHDESLVMYGYQILCTLIAVSLLAKRNLISLIMLWALYKLLKCRDRRYL